MHESVRGCEYLSVDRTIPNVDVGEKRFASRHVHKTKGESFEDTFRTVREVLVVETTSLSNSVHAQSDVDCE